MDRETYRRAHLRHKETDRENKRQLAKERQETKQRYLKSMDENLETTRSYCEVSLSIIKGASRTEQLNTIIQGDSESPKITTAP